MVSDLAQQIKAVAYIYGITEDELVKGLPHPATIRGLSDDAIVKLAEVVAKDLAKRKGKE